MSPKTGFQCYGSQMLKLGRPRWVPILAALMVVGFAAGRSNAQTGAVNSIPDGPGGKATSSEVANPKQPTVQTSGTSSPAPQADDTQAPGKAAPGPPPVYYVEPVDRPAAAHRRQHAVAGAGACFSVHLPVRPDEK